jgi:phage shock protein PspC (stress-responsive transcriptional regulator)
MTKANVTKIFLAGVLAAIAGGIVVLVTGGIAYTNDVFIMNGQEVVGLRSGPLTWTLLGVGLVGALAMAAGAIAGLIAWIGALLNVSQLESKIWFVVLLLLGLTNFGILGMIAYIIAGPDGSNRAAVRQVPAPVGA